jgi:hypothetical protein
MIRKSEHELWSPPIWVDFNDLRGDRLPIMVGGGTADDLQRHRIALQDGLKLTLFTLDGSDISEVDDLVGLGVVASDSGYGWVAVVPPRSLRHVSELDAIDRQLYLALRPEGLSGPPEATHQG